MIKTVLLALGAIFLAFTMQEDDKVTVYLVGDSTVQNGSGEGQGGLWGWGAFLEDQLDTNKVKVVNKARGGRSSRTFIAEGLWDAVHSRIDSGDYVIIQFGHNDGGNINDDFRARGTFKSNSDTLAVIDNILTRKREIVSSYGWYIRKYIHDTRAKGGIPIVCSLVARNRWEEGNVIRATDSYTKWAKQAAEQEGAYFIDLNHLVATKYEELGQQYVTDSLFLSDHTHTNYKGAVINAKLVADAIKNLEGCKLGQWVKN